jgi:hypothetical protein
MVELLIDLVGTRLHYPPVPITLLNTLSLVCLKKIFFINCF